MLAEYKTPESLMGMLGFGDEDHLRFGWITKGYKGENNYSSKWYPLGRHETKKTINTNDFYSDVKAHEDSDVYFSPNEFFSWRNTKQISSLHANYLDIDTVGHEVLTTEQGELILNEVFEQLIDSGIPWPTGIVKSGSGGVHLYWVYDPVPAYKYNVAAWKQITEKLASVLTGGKLWKVDLSPSLDASRLLRLPGSVHPKSGRVVTEQIIVPDLYSFKDLLKSFGIPYTNDKKISLISSASKPTKKHSKKLKQKRQAVGKHNIKTWWATTYFHIVTKGRTRGFTHGQRDYAAFMLYVALLHIKDCPDAAFYQTSTNLTGRRQLTWPVLGFGFMACFLR